MTHLGLQRHCPDLCFQQIIHTPRKSGGSINNCSKSLHIDPGGLSSLPPTQRGMFYRCITFKPMKETRMSSLSLTALLEFSKGQMSLRLSIQNAEVIAPEFQIVKESINHLNEPFFFFFNTPPPIVSHQSAASRCPRGLRHCGWKSMPCKVLLGNNMPRDSTPCTFLIAL